MPRYIPPSSTNLPFVFSDMGYSKPKYSPLDFNFRSETAADLMAAINVMTETPLTPPYLTTAYTYLKGCPKYIIGYTTYGVQILSGRCLYGGIRDLQAILTVDEKNHDQSAIFGIIKGYSSDFSNLNAEIRLWNPSDISAVLEGTHDPSDISAFVKVFTHGVYDLSANLQPFHFENLNASLGVFQYTDLVTEVNPIPAMNLPTYLNVWPQVFLPANIMGWGSLDLGAYLNQVYSYDLPSSLVCVDDTIKNMRGIIKGIGKGTKDLSAFSRGMIFDYLQATIRATYFNSFPATIIPELPRSIYASIHGWDERFLPASITITEYPWELHAYLNITGGHFSLGASLLPKKDVHVIKNLTAQLSSWSVYNMTASILGDAAHVLSASLTPTGNARDIHASIYPKMIRLTTIVRFSTLKASDLSSTINCHCGYSDYKDLTASLYTKYKSDLYAYIKPTYIYTYKNLTASIGLSNAYSEIDKHKISIIIYPGVYITTDSFRVSVSILRGGNFLGASIIGILSNKDLSATLTAQRRSRVYYEEPIKNREKVVSTNYSGVFRSYEIVEFYFREMVNEYYYSSDGDYAWKSNRFDKWILDVSSYLPANTSLGIKRKFHKAIDLYDLKKFSSVDEALRYAIDYVTTYPLTSISASLLCRGSYNNMTAHIIPAYKTTTNTGLSAYINTVTSEIFISDSLGVQKI